MGQWPICRILKPHLSSAVFAGERFGANRAAERGLVKNLSRDLYSVGEAGQIFAEQTSTLQGLSLRRVGRCGKEQRQQHCRNGTLTKIQLTTP